MSGVASGRDARRVSLSELMRLGEALGQSLALPAFVAIEGDLGTGKTTLVQAICRGLEVTEDVTSPTFSLVHHYRTGRVPVYHLDLYRLRGPEDLTNIGWDDIVDSEAVVLLEWPERAGAQLPSTARRIAIRHVGARPDHRDVRGL